MAPSVLSFEHLNLRRNPFGELTVDEWRELADVCLTDVLEFLRQPSDPDRPSVVQVTGEKGFGKTTHLLAIQGHFPDSSYTWLPAGHSVPVQTTGCPVIVDEAQRLTWRQRRALWRIPKGLVLGTHADFSRPLHNAGRRVLTISADRNTTPERVWRLLNARIEIVCRSPGPIPQISASVAESLCQRYGSDIRAMLHFLYDHFQKLRTVNDVGTL